jgi:hypothetical protein
MREVLGRGRTLNDRYRTYDLYETDPECVRQIIQREKLYDLSILENSAGNGRIVKELRAAGNRVFANDIVQRDFELDLVSDFLLSNIGAGVPLSMRFDCAVYNPPFALLNEFIEQTWAFTDRQIIFCRLQCLEGKTRFENIYKHRYLKKLYVYTHRVKCDDPTYKGNTANSMCFCWLVLDKNNKKKPTIEWIN